jgi:ATP-dependent protease ClpP protease subunit
MKKIDILFLSLLVLLAGVGLSWSNHDSDAGVSAKEDVEVAVRGCPVTHMTDNARCMDCHVMKVVNGKPVFGLKEIDPHKQYNYPCYTFKFKDEQTAHVVLNDINDRTVSEVFEYLTRYSNINKLIIEMHNPGGSMFGMWRIVSLMDQYKNSGRVIETQCQGFSASASFIIFVNGSKGHRFVAPESFHMWHEAMSFSMFDIKTASSTEEEAKIMRKFQDTAHHWLAKRSKVEKTKFDELVAKREWWLTGNEMVEFGLADGFIK